MTISVTDVELIFRKLQESLLSREDAEDWAAELIAQADAGELEYLPDNERGRIWKAIIFISGIGLRTSPKDYLHSFRDLEDFINAHGWTSKPTPS